MTDYLLFDQLAMAIDRVFYYLTMLLIIPNDEISKTVHNVSHHAVKADVITWSLSADKKEITGKIICKHSHQVDILRALFLLSKNSF